MYKENVKQVFENLVALSQASGTPPSEEFINDITLYFEGKISIDEIRDNISKRNG